MPFLSLSRFQNFLEEHAPRSPTNLVPLSFIFKSPDLKIRSAVSVDGGVQDSPLLVSVYIDGVLLTLRLKLF